MQYLITPQFAGILPEGTLESLNRHSGTVFGLDDSFKLAYLNPAWFQFAEENSNGAFNPETWTLGKSIFDVIPEDLNPIYRELFNKALAANKDDSISPQEFEYECSSPELFRKFSMHLYPLNKQGILVVNSLLIEEPYIPNHAKEAHVFNKADYVDENNALRQCANCRRIKNLHDPERWDWIPELIRSPYPGTSHGVCSICAQHYYLS